MKPTQTSGPGHLRRLRSRFLAGASRVADDATVARRATLALIGMLAVILGAWGFVDLSAHSPEAQLGWSEVIYGTISLFPSNAEVQPVPWQLDLARVLAPLALAGFFAEIAIVSIASGLRAQAASRATDHLVVLGPSDRIKPYLSASKSGSSHALTVHIGSDTGRNGQVVRVTEQPGADAWVSDSGAIQARRVVLASGHDVKNLSALYSALAHGIPHSGGQLIVEIDDRSVARRVAVELARDRPDADIEVVCVADARAALAARTVIEHLEGRRNSHPGSPYSAAIVGDTELCRFLIEHLGRALATHTLTEGLTRPELLIIDPSASNLTSAVAVLDHRRIEVTVTHELGEIARETAPPAVIVDLAEPDRSAQVATDLALRRRGCTVWFVGEQPLAWTTDHEASGPTETDLRLLSLEQVESRGYLAGPFTRIGYRRAAIAQDPNWTRLIGWPNELVQQRHLWEAETARLRAAVSRLLANDWQVLPEPDFDPIMLMQTPQFLDSETQSILGVVASDPPSYVVHELRSEGLVLIRKQVGLHAVAPAKMPDDSAIESMARSIHEAYQASLVDETADLPAARDWQRLDKVHRSLNWDQARDNIAKLAALGLEVVPQSQATISLELTETQVQLLGRLEHDRWADQRRRQGYRLGEPRNDGQDGPDLRHPDLVHWDELTETDQEKDMAPMRRIPDVLRAAGLGLRASAEESGTDIDGPEKPTRP